ncbi:MAG: pyruvate, water dikinase regulatory protein [Arenicellales bacterium]
MTTTNQSLPMRSVYILSDRTGVTAGTMSHTLLSQFPNITFERHTIPFVDADDKVKSCIRQINSSHKKDKVAPLVFTSFTDNDFNDELKKSEGIIIDLFGPFINDLEKHLHSDSSHKSGQAHGINKEHDYMHRIDAINFSMKYDDGVRMEDYQEADLILIGVSRAGKTPTSLYMALHYGLHTANYPLADDDFEKGEIPRALLDARKKLFALTIDPAQLHKIREQRRPNSPYSSLQQCRREVMQAQQFYKRYRIPFADSTAMSIEELASFIVHRMNLEVSYL